jgi:hypothetical protein
VAELGVRTPLLTVRLWASTSTTVVHVHNGAVLPYARVVVVLVPLVILSGLWWLVVHRNR